MLSLQAADTQIKRVKEENFLLKCRFLLRSSTKVLQVSEKIVICLILVNKTTFKAFLDY